jgi:hypothetical protein
VTPAEAAEADRLIVELLREAEEKIERRSRLQAMADEDSVGDGPSLSDSDRQRHFGRAGAPRGVAAPSACGVGMRKKR